jgi:hypothetical protein
MGRWWSWAGVHFLRFHILKEPGHHIMVFQKLNAPPALVGGALD